MRTTSSTQVNLSALLTVPYKATPTASYIRLL